MSTNPVLTSYFISTENDENRENTKLRAKHGETLETRLPGPGKRTVLGTLTNKPFVDVVGKPKQDESCGTQSIVVGDKTCKSGLNAQVCQPPLQSISHQALPLPKPVDLSCHEDDVSMDLGSAPADYQHDDDMGESQESVILLDTMSSEEDTIEDNDVMAEMEQKERTERLMTMAEYRDEIYGYLRKAEVCNRPRANYMQRQTDITANMRTILVDWLVEVADEYHLHRETLFLAVDFVDRFLSVMAVQRSKLQLVGTAAMFIAAKYEEIYPPDVSEFVYITDDTYTKQQVLRMEHLLLKVLRFDVAVPTSNVFCDRFLKETNADEKTVSLAMYLVESSLLDGDTFLPYLPSITAASAVCLANLMLGLADPWPSAMQQSTQYTMRDLNLCLRDLILMVMNLPSLPQQAIREKYKSAKYQEVSSLQPPQALCEQWLLTLKKTDS